MGRAQSHRRRFAFGGEDDAGSCGELEHVVILNAGGTDAPSAEGPDPSALSLYGCGFGTTVNHVEIAHSGGNGINLRGGAALFSDAAVWDFARDGVVASNGYRGALRRLYVDAPTDARSALRSEGTWPRRRIGQHRVSHAPDRLLGDADGVGRPQPDEPAI